MSSYDIAVLALLLAAIAQTSALWLIVEAFFTKGQPPARRFAWFGLGGAALFLALQHGHALELALRTGLFDLRQSSLATLISLCFVGGVVGFRRS